MQQNDYGPPVTRTDFERRIQAAEILERGSSGLVVEPDHPERHDLWGSRGNSARFTAHRKYFCPVDPIVHGRRSGQTFSFVEDEEEAEDEEKEAAGRWRGRGLAEKEERRDQKAGGRAPSGPCTVIMDSTIGKSETSERESASSCGRPLSFTRRVLYREDHLLVTSYFVQETNGPRRLPFNDHNRVPGIPVTPPFVTTYRSRASRQLINRALPAGPLTSR